jgi:hypothetical protein
MIVSIHHPGCGHFDFVLCMTVFPEPSSDDTTSVNPLNSIEEIKPSKKY